MWVLIIMALNGRMSITATPVYFATEEACMDAQIKLSNAYQLLNPQPTYAITCLSTHTPTPNTTK